MRRGRWGLYWCALLAPLCLLVAAGCLHKPTATPRPPSPVATASAADYLGSDACAGCHAQEYGQHHTGRHRSTLRPLDPRLLGRNAPPSGRIPGSDIVLVRQADGYAMSRQGMEAAPVPIELEFGSGKTGMTFGVERTGGEMVEVSRSYFPSRRLWYLTPGHEARPKEEVGLLCTAEEAQHCLRCHGVPEAFATHKLEPRMMGVGCETCHGPGRAHAAAMQAGRTSDLRLPRLSQLSGEAAIKLCSACHRGKDSVKLGTEQEHMTNRFQAFGLMQSRCYIESQGKLSCVTCHNPHADAAVNLASYTPTCLSCHSGAAPTSRTAQGKICPVNPREGCAGCHMPSRPVFTNSQVPVNMAEHLIRVYRPAGAVGRRR